MDWRGGDKGTRRGGDKKENLMIFIPKSILRSY
jgi:hypothetical protein